MIHRGFFLFCLLALSLITTATVHAQERPGMATVECSGVVHSDGDADQSPGDADRAVPHHHSSCHGFAAFVPAGLDAAGAGAAASVTAFMPPAIARSRWSAGPGLRPPIA